ncbi:MAG: hypothetical protein JW829_12560 [Pirellulales bacterium]|nr:hypothetical protein [Pirellulales bacterium]
MKSSNRKTLLTIMVLLFIGIILLHYMRSTTYTVEEIDKELSFLCGEYDRLCKQHITPAQWQGFGDTLRERTAPLIEDMDRHMAKNRPGSQALYQLAKYLLPRAVASNGQMPVAELERWLKRSRKDLRRYDVTINPSKYKSKRKSKWRQDAEGGTDWITVGVVFFDIVLLGALGYMFFKAPSGEVKTEILDKDKMVLLEKLHGRILHDPKAASYRAMRARLLVEMKQYEDALADIDWILNQKPHGVDLEAWNRLRDSVTRRLTDKAS